MALGTFVSLAYSQTGQQGGKILSRVTENLDEIRNRSINPNAPKALLCRDTVKYTQFKQAVINPAEFYNFALWQEDAESMSQTFFHSGANMNIHGVEFFARVNTNSLATSVSTRASIWTVNASNNPVTQLVSGTVTVTGTATGIFRVNFASPIVVSGNFALVIEPITVNGVIDVIVNDPLPGQVQDENLSRFKSLWPSYNSGGNWVSIPTSFPSNDFEIVAAPIVTYNLNTAYTATPNPVCAGTPVTFTNTTAPASILNNRMFTFGRMLQQFGGAVGDSTYAWTPNGAAPFTWSTNFSHTYPTAGGFNSALFTLGGMSNTCIDNATVAITVNALPTVSASADNSSICAGQNATISASGATTYSWNQGLGAGGSHTVSPSTTTTYTVTGTTSGCSATAQVTVNVTPLENANFNYSSNTLCTGGSNETPTTFAPGTFSSTPAGLVFVNSSTGEIDMTNSNDGVYSVTYTTSGACPGTSSQSITITSSPEAEFSYAQNSYCNNGTNPAPIFGAGASAGTFTVDIAGLSISSSTGVINLAASNAGTYNVTNTIAAAGACPADQETVQITIYDAPTAIVTGGGSVCGDGSTPIDVTITLTGAAPWNFTYSDGTSTQSVTNQSSPVFVISASNSGTYTVTTVSDQNCAATGSGSAVVTFNANPTVSAGGNQTVCEGALVTLNASGAQTYVWTEGVENGVAFTATSTETYEVTGTDGNGCTGTATVTVTVNENPVVTLSAFESLCDDASPLTLSGGSPAGGTYSGTGVTGGIFNPSMGAGTYDITYTYTSTENCTASATQSILVESCASIEDWAMAANLTIFPNPASDELTISFFNTSSEQVRVSLLGADGKLIAVSVAKPFSQYTESTDVTSLASGMYMVRFETAMGTEVRKVIVK